jgi:hypothetical protein
MRFCAPEGARSSQKVNNKRGHRLHQPVSDRCVCRGHSEGVTWHFVFLQEKLVFVCGPEGTLYVASYSASSDTSGNYRSWGRRQDYNQLQKQKVSPRA